jgi:large subunit ribosomal protein L29
MAGANEMRELNADELLIKLRESKEELFNLRFQLATGQLDNPTRMRVVRHEVARIATVLREREIEEELDRAAEPAVETEEEQR